MRHKKYLTFFFILAAAFFYSSCSQAAFEEIGFNEKWHGNCLWVASQQNPKIPAGWVDPAKWIALFPGSWEEAMVSFIISSPANAGMKDVYWDVYNSNGMLLYPSEAFSSKVYRNPNSGHDFFVTDMAQIAAATAKLDDINLKYTVWWNEGVMAPDIVKELIYKYPLTGIAVVASQSAQLQIKQKLSGILSDRQLERITLTEPAVIDAMIDLTNCDRDPLKSHDFHKEMINKYLHFGNVVFKRDIIIYEDNSRCTIAVSGRNKWHLFVNGKFIASGVWKDGTWQDMSFLSGTYDVSELMKQGKNTIVVVVESGFNERAFMANIRVGDMIYRCDDNWQAMPIDEIPSEENIGLLCQKQDWQIPIKLARANIWPNAMGKVYWHRLYRWQDDAIAENSD